MINSNQRKKIIFLQEQVITGKDPLESWRNKLDFTKSQIAIVITNRKMTLVSEKHNKPGLGNYHLTEC